MCGVCAGYPDDTDRMSERRVKSVGPRRAILDALRLAPFTRRGPPRRLQNLLLATALVIFLTGEPVTSCTLSSLEDPWPLNSTET